MTTAGLAARYKHCSEAINVSSKQVEEVLRSYDGPAETHQEHPVWQLLEEIVAKTTNTSAVTANRLRNILWQFKEAFHTPGAKLGATPVVKHTIPVKDERRAVYTKSRPLSKVEMDRALEFIDRLVRDGIMERCPTPSAYGTPFALIPKATAGKWRFISQFIGVNHETVLTPQFPMARIDDNLALSQGYPIRSITDFQDGFYQIEIAEEDRHKTATSIEGVGQFQYARMAMGLTGSPSTFNYAVHVVVGWLRRLTIDGAAASVVATFVDDMLVASNTEEAHLYHWHVVLRALTDARMTLNANKTQLFQSEVQYCGRVSDGISIYPLQQDIDTVYNWVKPATLSKLCSFLGFTNYLTQHVKDEKKFADILRSMEVSKDQRKFLVWSVEGHKAWDDIREGVRKATRLAIPVYDDPQHPFLLNTDASDFAIGAVLSQAWPTEEDPKATRVISYYSKALNTAQRKYKVVEKEAYACVCALERYRKNIYGQHLTILTDAKVLRDCFQRGVSNNAMITRWLLIIQDFSPVYVEHIMGVDNTGADVLSRNENLREYSKLSEEEKEAFGRGPYAMLAEPKQRRALRVEAQAPTSTMKSRSAQATPQQVDAATTLKSVADLWSVEMKEEQRKEDKLAALMELLEKPYASLSIKEQNDIRFFMLVDGVLYKIASPKSKLVVPTAYRNAVIHEFHNTATAGHYGIVATVHRIAVDFYWENMWKSVSEYCNKCASCAINKPGPHTVVRTGSIGADATHPFHTVNLDIKGPLPTTKCGNRFIVAFVCTRTNWAEAYATTDHTAKTVARLFVDVIMKHGVPRRVITDKGSEFGSAVFTGLLASFNVEYKANPPYSPFLSGKVERFNRSLGQILRHYLQSYGKNWDSVLPFALMAYRTAHQEALKCSPFFALYGRHPESLPATLLNLAAHPDDDTRELQQRMAEIRALSEKHSAPTAHLPSTAPFLTPGHSVMVRNRSKNKLTARWLGPFTVTKVQNELITCETKRGREFTTNRSHTKRALVDDPYDNDYSDQSGGSDEEDE